MMRFLPIKGYEERYIIWEDGTVTTIKRTIFCHGRYIDVDKPRNLNPSKDKKGYLVVNLYRGPGEKAKCAKVHRLVAEAFIPNPLGKRCVCHKDNNPLNNTVSNLYWGTDQENQDQAWKDGLHHSEMPVNMISKSGEVTKFKSQAEAARITGISQQNISRCVRGERMEAGGYKWQKSD